MAEQQQIPQQRTPLRKEDYKTKKLLQLIEAKLKTQESRGQASATKN
jgi:hypothetical protein